MHPDSPLSLAIGLRVVDQLENDLAVQQRQRDLQLERARYEARLAQRQYDAVDQDNRLVASELERRWNEKLETGGTTKIVVYQLDLTTAQTLGLAN